MMSQALHSDHQHQHQHLHQFQKDQRQRELYDLGDDMYIRQLYILYIYIG